MSRRKHTTPASKSNPMAKDLRQPKYRLKVFTDKTKIIPRKWKYKNGNS